MAKNKYPVEPGKVTIVKKRKKRKSRIIQNAR